MNATTNTWKDTFGCTVVLLAMFVGTMSGLLAAFADPAAVTAAVFSTLV